MTDQHRHMSRWNRGHRRSRPNLVQSRNATRVWKEGGPLDSWKSFMGGLDPSFKAPSAEYSTLSLTHRDYRQDPHKIYQYYLGEIPECRVPSALGSGGKAVPSPIATQPDSKHVSIFLVPHAQYELLAEVQDVLTDLHIRELAKCPSKFPADQFTHKSTQEQRPLSPPAFTTATRFWTTYRTRLWSLRSPRWLTDGAEISPFSTRRMSYEKLSSVSSWANY
jgi:hypothetical protein